MRKLSAHYIFPSSGHPLKYGIIIVDNNGRILDLIDTKGKLKEEANLEFYPGILAPGFVNAHCHLELSHMLGVIPKKSGIIGFIEQISEKRIENKDKITKAASAYSEEIFRTGTSAVADIVNTDDTIRIKQDSPLYWHNFVEIFGLNSSDAGKIWKSGIELKEKFDQTGLPASISPHAPYSISQELWHYFQSNPTELLSIHNQESKEEEYLMSSRQGKLAEWFKAKGFNTDNLPPVKKTSLESTINFFPDSKRVLLVHNTFSKQKDIELATSYFAQDSVYWVLCPNSNLYIENKLPEKLIENKESINICLGTDSLASNSSLSVLEEMKTLQKHFPSIKLEELIKWASINGAKALGIEDKYGSFEIGKKPGVVWINNISYPGPVLSPKSKSVRLV